MIQQLQEQKFTQIHKLIQRFKIMVKFKFRLAKVQLQLLEQILISASFFVMVYYFS